MRVRVFPLRRRGRRLAWSEVRNGPAYDGELLTHRITMGGEQYHVATLRPLDPAEPSPLGDLFEPVLVGIAMQAFRLRGYERCDEGRGAFAAVQEWHCEL